MKKIIIPLKKIKTIEKAPIFAVKAKIGNIKGYLILDTGSQINVISDSIKNYSQEEFTIFDKIVTISEDIVKDVKVVSIKNAKFGNKSINLGYCCVIDLKHIQSIVKPNYTILGLLGLNFLMEQKAIINFKTKKLILYYN
jgi:hypothetical protein